MPGQPQNDDPVGSFLEDLVTGVGHTIRGLWRYRLELAFTAPLAAAAIALADESVIVKASAGILAAAVVAWQWGRLDRALRRARARRRWTTIPDAPRIKGVHSVPAGDVLDVRVPRGTTVEQLAGRADVIADDLGVLGVTVTRSGPGRASVLIKSRDPFDGAPPDPWPWLDRDEASVWEPMPFAVDETGSPVTVETMGGHVLIAGVTGSGKSVALQLFVATCALDPTAHLYLLDGKRLELAPWAPCARVFAAENMTEAIGVLHHVQDLMAQRMSELQAQGRRSVGPGDPTHHLIIDELATYVSNPNRKLKADFIAALLHILQQGRAAGFRVIAAMQRPSAELVNANVREQFSYRIGFRTTSGEATRMIFGTADGCAAHLIPRHGFAGVGYIEHQGEYRRVRSYYLPDDAITDLSSRATGGRVDHELAGLLPPPPPSSPATERSSVQARPAKPASAGETDADDRRRVTSVLPSDESDAATLAAVAEASGMSIRRTRDVLDSLRDSAAVQCKRGRGRGGPMVYWRPSEVSANSADGRPL